jgi:hypothetical protein
MVAPDVAEGGNHHIEVTRSVNQETFVPMDTTLMGARLHTTGHAPVGGATPESPWVPEPALIADISRVVHNATWTVDGGSIGGPLCTVAARRVLDRLHAIGRLS